MADEPCQGGGANAGKLAPAGLREDGFGWAAVEIYYAFWARSLIVARGETGSRHKELFRDQSPDVERVSTKRTGTVQASDLI
jgi:hypothetical protein